jgi:hypothetical protein
MVVMRGFVGTLSTVVSQQLASFIHVVYTEKGLHLSVVAAAVYLVVHSAIFSVEQPQP